MRLLVLVIIGGVSVPQNLRNKKLAIQSTVIKKKVLRTYFPISPPEFGTELLSYTDTESQEHPPQLSKAKVIQVRRTREPAAP